MNPVTDPAKYLNVPIRWHLLTDALAHYKNCGYQEAAVPWLVSKPAMQVTFPARDKVFAENNGGYETCYGDLVGSAEQSFIQMQIDGLLPPGRYVALSPCFRIEPEYDDLHFPYFAKTELYVTDDPTLSHLNKIIEEALAYFRSLADPRVEFTIEKTDIGYDINANGTEVGSYNRVEHQGVTWLCGTAMAEPRFSTVCFKEN